MLIAGFSNGILPTKKTVIENMLYLMRPTRAGQGQHSKQTAALTLAEILPEHWIFCNVYTVTTKVIKKILILYSDFVTLLQTRKERRNKNFIQRTTVFHTDAQKLFDIFCEDNAVRKKNIAEVWYENDTR